MKPTALLVILYALLSPAPAQAFDTGPWRAMSVGATIDDERGAALHTRGHLDLVMFAFDGTLVLHGEQLDGRLNVNLGWPLNDNMARWFVPKISLGTDYDTLGATPFYVGLDLSFYFLRGTDFARLNMVSAYATSMHHRETEEARDDGATFYLILNSSFSDRTFFTELRTRWSMAPDDSGGDLPWNLKTEALFNYFFTQRLAIGGGPGYEHINLGAAEQGIWSGMVFITIRPPRLRIPQDMSRHHLKTNP